MQVSGFASISWSSSLVFLLLLFLKSKPFSGHPLVSAALDPALIEPHSFSDAIKTPAWAAAMTVISGYPKAKAMDFAASSS